MALAFVAYPPCAYYGFDVMHDDMSGGKTGVKSYTWLLAPLGVLAAGIAYASSNGALSSAPPKQLDLESTGTPAHVASSFCTPSTAPSGRELNMVLGERAKLVRTHTRKSRGTSATICHVR